MYSNLYDINSILTFLLLIVLWCLYPWGSDTQDEEL
jgi:hypothetical protein